MAAFIIAEFFMIFWALSKKIVVCLAQLNTQPGEASLIINVNHFSGMSDRFLGAEGLSDLRFLEP